MVDALLFLYWDFAIYVQAAEMTVCVCRGVPIRQQGRVSESKVVDRKLLQYFSSSLLHPPEQPLYMMLQSL